MVRTIYNRNRQGPKQPGNKRSTSTHSAEVEQRAPSRVTVRLQTTNEIMALIEHAARSVGKPLPDFVIDAALEKACQLLASAGNRHPRCIQGGGAREKT